MNFTYWVKLALFFNSFSFAFLVTAFLNRAYFIQGPKFMEQIFEKVGLRVSMNLPWVSIVCVGLVAISGIVMLLAYRKLKSMNPQIVAIKTVANKADLMNSYVLSNLMPFAFANLSSESTDRLVLTVAFLVFLTIINATGDYFYINPVLSLFGYNIYDVVDQSENNWTVITKEHLITKTEIKAVRFTNGSVMLQTDPVV